MVFKKKKKDEKNRWEEKITTKERQERGMYVKLVEGVDDKTLCSFKYEEISTKRFPSCCVHQSLIISSYTNQAHMRSLYCVGL